MAQRDPRGKPMPGPHRPPAAPPAPPPHAGSVWMYCQRLGWHQVPDPLPPDPTGLDELLAAAGFESAFDFGGQHNSLTLTVHLSHERDLYYFALSGPAHYRSFLAADTPSALDLLRRLVPTIRAAAELDRLGDEHEREGRKRWQYDAQRRQEVWQ